jgi:hypothetical protein
MTQDEFSNDEGGSAVGEAVRGGILLVLLLELVLDETIRSPWKASNHPQASSAAASSHLVAATCQ